MRVKVTKNKNSQSFYVIKDVNVAGKSLMIKINTI